MKRTAAILITLVSFMLSGCTVAHFYYVRNLSDKDATVYFHFDGASVNGIILPDSIFVPYSETSHLINKNTYIYMKDSIVTKKWNFSAMRMVIPSGGMIMFDKVTLKKVSYATPSSIEVIIPGKQSYTVHIEKLHEEGKQFREKGKIPHLHWYDIY